MTESHTYAAVFKVNLCDGSRVVGQLLVRVIHYLCYMVKSLLEPVTPTDTPTENYTVTRMYVHRHTHRELHSHTYVHRHTHKHAYICTHKHNSTMNGVRLLSWFRHEEEGGL